MNINRSCQTNLTNHPLFNIKMLTIFASNSVLVETMLLRIMIIKFPCIRNSMLLFPNIWAFNSNLKQPMLSKTMIMNFPKTLKKDIKLPSNFSVFGKHMINLKKYVNKNECQKFGQK